IFLALLERLRLQHEVQMPARSVVASERGQPFYEQIEGLMLAVDKHKGILIIYARRELRGTTINLSFGFHDSSPKVDLAASVIGRKRKGSTVYIAVFSSLELGNYTLHTDSWEYVAKVSILSGKVTEVDWR